MVERREIRSRTRFSMVERAAALTATPEVDKVVLSRLIDITTRDRVDSGALMERLIAQNPPALTSTCRSPTACCWAPARSCCCVKKDSTSALPLAGSPVASRTMC
ncbi:Isochorismate synthase EntC [Klebsiella pneumoniae]|nr:Isochorismate synthase EntC [Klebsiella pneumoniae]